MLVNFIKKLRDLYLVHVKWRKYSIGPGFHAGRKVVLWAKNELIIGKQCYIGRYTQIECDAVIGDYVMFANQVALVGRYDHNYQQVGVPIRMASQIRDEDYQWKGLDSKVVIEDDVWVGYGAIILSGSYIAKGSIIAAGSVVAGKVEPYSIYGGVPAKKLGERFSSPGDISNHERLMAENF